MKRTEAYCTQKDQKGDIFIFVERDGGDESPFFYRCRAPFATVDGIGCFEAEVVGTRKELADLRAEGDER